MKSVTQSPKNRARGVQRGQTRPDCENEGNKMRFVKVCCVVVDSGRWLSAGNCIFPQWSFGVKVDLAGCLTVRLLSGKSRHRCYRLQKRICCCLPSPSCIQTQESRAPIQPGFLIHWGKTALVRALVRPENLTKMSVCLIGGLIILLFNFFKHLFICLSVVRFFNWSKPVLYAIDRLWPTNMTLLLYLCVFVHLCCLLLIVVDRCGLVTIDDLVSRPASLRLLPCLLLWQRKPVMKPKLHIHQLLFLRCVALVCLSMGGAGCGLKTSGYFIWAALKTPQREANQRANAWLNLH